MTVHAQGYPDSPVFRGYRPGGDRRDSRNDGLRRQIDVFLLERDAAGGDPLAQHELGVRLLTGNGIAPDTMRAAEWIRRAAVQSLAPAMYNYGLLLHNGRGTEWNPFAAYRMFRAAAELGMPEAQHVAGVFFTDNLVLRQNWDSAWTWTSRAAAAGYEPAIKARNEIQQRGFVRLAADSTLEKTTENRTQASSSQNTEDETDLPAWTPVMLDFSREPRTASVSTDALLDEVLASRGFSSQDSTVMRTLTGDHPDSAALSALGASVRWGNPEAMLLMGRLRTEGRHLSRDPWMAAELFATAVFLESPRAPMLLVDVLRNSGLLEDLSARAWAGDARAQYVLACLKAMDLETRITGAQAFELLRRAAAQELPAAITQLGIAYATGRWGTADMNAAEETWIHASALGYQEGRLRLAAAAVHGRSTRLDLASALTLLERGKDEGSLLAAVALAGSYEHGVGRTVNLGEAVRRYRECAIRGSSTAWRALLRLHDARRPDDPEFRIQ